MDLSKAPPQGTLELILITAVITSLLVGVFGKKLADALLGLILKPLAFIRDALYRQIAPRNPMSLSVRSYRKHLMRSNLTRIENPVGAHADVRLEHAFAPLKLISRENDSRVDLFVYARSAFRSVVLGGPGTGKTTLMKTLVVNTLSKRPAVEKVLPVFVVLRNLAREQHTVEKAIVAAFHTHHFPGADRFVESALATGRLLIVLDGLDEVGSNRPFVIEKIREFCEYDDQRETRNRLYITCREHSYRSMDLGGLVQEVLHVEPFASHHMRVFLEGWPPVKGRSANDLYRLIQADAQIRDICRNPLLLTILTGLYLVSKEDKFELPTSRQRFYQEAVDELLIQRPGRRSIVQSFDADAKRQILERAALDRLERFFPTEDPEEFSLATIQQHGTDILAKTFDVSELVKEMVEINGILRPTRDNYYTCAHRTIQEYLAAREAQRRRTVDEVVSTAHTKPELIEVLYFYCGLVENIPALTRVVDSLCARQQWIVAGRALAQMQEAPSAAVVDTVCGELLAMAKAGKETDLAMAVLAALSNRRGPSFAGAAPKLREAVDSLTQKDGSGASALETAINASPEIALKLIPLLLVHHDRRWKEAAVQLLGDLGTVEALEQLLGLLESSDEIVRQHAGLTLARLMPTRADEMKVRATLLRDRSAAHIWPLEAYFPARVMVPIAEAVAPIDEPTGNLAVDLAAGAVRAAERGGESAVSHNWKRMQKDLRQRARLARVAAWIRNVLSLAALATYAACLMLTLGSDRILIFTPGLQTVPGASADALATSARRLADRVEAITPPNASGWQRIWPWYWKVRPALDERGEQAYKALRQWEARRLDPGSLQDDLAAMAAFDGLPAAAEAKAVRQAAEPVRQLVLNRPALMAAMGGFSGSRLWILILPLLLIGFGALMFRRLLRTQAFVEPMGMGRRPSLSRSDRWTGYVGAQSECMAFLAGYLLFAGPWLPWVFLGIGLAFLIGGAHLAGLRLRIPRNQPLDELADNSRSSGIILPA